MPNPSFNGQYIFSSYDVNADPFCEGTLLVGTYGPIIQQIHFNGANGAAVLNHGWPNREWKYEGFISVPTDDVTPLRTILATIQNYADEADSDESTFHTLVDTLGYTYTDAQIHSFTPVMIQKANPGWIATVVITGIVKGMQQDGTSSGEESGE